MESNSYIWKDTSEQQKLDKILIQTLIDIYVVGLRSGRIDLLKKTFHQGAIVYSLSKGNKVRGGNMGHIIEIIAKNGPMKDVTFESSILHQTTDTAFVLTELKNTLPYHNSSNHLLLMKINGSWKIIAKIYHLSWAKKTKTYKLPNLLNINHKLLKFIKMANNKNNNTIADYDAIVSAAEAYVEGLKTGNVDQLKNSFHPDGLMAGFMPDGKLTTKLQFLFDFTAEHGEAPEVKAHISILHKAETAAAVLVELEDLQGGVGSTDYLSMLLINGEWKVISKAFNLYWGQN